MADYNYIENTGVILPDTSNVLTEVQQEYKEAFGADLPVTPETPQGVLITSETLSRMAVLRNNAALANQINPNLAGGPFLDAIWALTGGERDSAGPSRVIGVVLTGNPSTLVPAGTQVATSTGDVFRSVSAVVIGAGGTAIVDFESLVDGPIPASIGDLTNIVPTTAVLGLDTVTNPTAAILGSVTQSDASSRTERRQTLAKQGSSLALAIMSEVRSVPGVQSLSFRENKSNAPVVIDGIPLVAHSIWACVNGGTDLDVATAILSKKSGGCNYNGAVSVPVVEPASGQLYTVEFDRPTPVVILVRATVKGSALVDPIVATKQAILDYAAGNLTGEDGLQVDTDVSPFELSAAVNAFAPGIFVTKMEVAYDAGVPVYLTDTLPIALNEIASITEANIQVIVL